VVDIHIHYVMMLGYVINPLLDHVQSNLLKMNITYINVWSMHEISCKIVKLMILSIIIIIKTILTL
jgi:hypothetical protein